MPGWEKLLYTPDWEAIRELASTTWMSSLKHRLSTVQGAAAAQHTVEQ